MWNFPRNSDLQLSDHEKRMRRYVSISLELTIILAIARLFVGGQGEGSSLRDSHLPVVMIVQVATIGLGYFALLIWCILKWVYVRICGRITLALYLWQLSFLSLPVTIPHVISDLDIMCGVAIGFFMIRSFYPPDEPRLEARRSRIADDIRWIATSMAGWLGAVFVISLTGFAAVGSVSLLNGKQLPFSPALVFAALIFLAGPVIALWKEKAGAVITTAMSLIFLLSVILHPQYLLIVLAYMSMGVMHIVAARMSKVKVVMPPDKIDESIEIPFDNKEIITQPVEKQSASRDRAADRVRWTARILGVIVLILYCFIGVAFFVISGVKTFLGNGLMVIMFLTVVIIITGNVIAIKRERIGGLMLVISGTFFLFFLTINVGMQDQLDLFVFFLALPVILAGALYLVSWRMRRGNQDEHVQTGNDSL